MEAYTNYILQAQETYDIKAFNSRNRIINEFITLNDIYKEFADTMTS